MNAIRNFLPSLCIAICLCGCTASTQGTLVKNGPVQAQLIPQSASITPGTPFQVAVHLNIDKGWHVYWKNPGDSGLPLEIKWELPEGFSAGAPQWPYPEKYFVAPLMTYIFKEKLFLPVPITLPAQLEYGSITTIKARVNWLVCEDTCIPGHATVEIPLTVRHEMPVNPLWQKNWAALEPKLPLTQSDWSMHAQTTEHGIILQMTNPAPFRLSDVYFFADQDNVIKHPAPQELNEINGGYELRMVRSSVSTGPIDRIQGVLTSKEGWQMPGTHKALAINIPVSQNWTPAPSVPVQPVFPLLIVLAFAFVGGLLLNLMPCVLPVLSLKILGFIKQSEHDPSKLRTHGLVFAGGVLCSFWALAVALLFFKAAGHQIGWGFQFQSPWFLGFLASVFFIFALNLFGVFEIQTPAISSALSGRPKSKWAGVFFNGVLATIAATPCSAPFMGTALGYGLSQPAGVSIAIFTCLALGMSFPYLLFSFCPSLLHFLPKPGAWMIHFKRILGALMLASCIWLLWVLQIRLVAPSEPSLNTSLNSTGRIAWQPYSPALIEQSLAQHKIIFIDFTARWCLSCKVNEHFALNNPAVVQKFQDLGVVMVMADWTLRDDRITKALAQYGKNSIPLYVLYSKNSKQPVILPELITPAIVLNALDKINSNDAQ